MSDVNLNPNVMQQIGLAARGFTRIHEGRLRALGFAVGQIPVLVALKKGKALPQAELARIARVEQPSMAQLLARMERDGLIQRIPDPADKRSRLISLTAAADKNLAPARAVLLSGTAQALEGFSEEEIASFVSMLQRLNANIDRAYGQDDG
jgi:MarR family transcriptional regulator for hemolysin